MKTITFPVGYRTGYLKEFLGYLSSFDLSDYKIICSAENCPPCVEVLKTCGLPLTILHKPNSTGVRSHSGARDNMYNVLSHAFNSGSDFNVHLEDDFVLSPDIFNLANWYYENFKDKPLTYMSYGFFNHESRGDDYSGLEVINVFEGLGWCTFKEGWELCYSKNWYNDDCAQKWFDTYGWDWAVSGSFREFGWKGIRPLIARTNHGGRYNGTCCTTVHHDKHYGKLLWNQTEIVKEFKLLNSDVRSNELVLSAIL